MSGQDATFSAFISYAAADKERAFEIVASIEARGLKCWIAPRNVRPAREYAEEIVRGIENSRCLVLVLSEAANQSVFVRREVERAVSKRKPVFPVRIEDVLPSPSLELFVSATHWIDAWTGNLVTHIEHLAGVIASDEAGGPFTPAPTAVRSVQGSRMRPAAWWLGGGTAAILVAAATYYFAVGFEETPVAPLPEIAAEPVPPYVPPAAERQSMYVPQGFDIGAVDRDDFEVTVDDSPGPKVHIKPKEKSLENALAIAELHYGIDGGPIDKTARLFVIELGILGPSSRDVKEVTIEYRYPDGVAIGPFSYPVDALASRRDRFKKNALAAQSWAECNGLVCSFWGIRDAVPAVEAVELHDPGSGKRKRVDVPPVPDNDLSKTNFQDYVPIVLFASTGVPTAELIFVDGTRTEPRKSKNANGDLGHDSLSPPGAVQLEATAAPPGSVAPEVFGIRIDYPSPDWAFLVDLPPGLDRVLYTHDKGGFFKAERLGSYDSDFMEYRNIFRFGPPSAGNILRLEFASDSGGKNGPYEYKIDWAGVLLSSYGKWSSGSFDEAISCGYVERQPSSDPFADAMKALDVTNSEHWFYNEAKESSVVCSGGSLSWIRVKEVEIGFSPEKLDVVAPVRVSADDIITGKWDGRRAFMGGSKPFAVWYGIVPGPKQDVYARFVFHDGSKSEVRRYRTG